jgi:hypothetical protein
MEKEAKILFTINSNTIALVSLVITLVSILWNVFFGYGKLIGRMDAMQEDINEIKVDVREMKSDLRKMDVRVTVLEQRKP